MQEAAMTREPFIPYQPPPCRRVLVVEDSPALRESLRVLLQLWGHRVEVAGDGLAGVRLGLEWRPEAGIIDLDLPLLGGLEVARRLREGLGEAVLLIALTGLIQAEERVREAGFDAYLRKPAEVDRLYCLLARPASPPARSG
jgi:DNA-binding response OmpR family regulator